MGGCARCACNRVPASLRMRIFQAGAKVTIHSMPKDDPVSTSESPCAVRAEGSHSLLGAARHASVGEETMAVLWSQQISLLV